jgi:hypothetical protein
MAGYIKLHRGWRDSPIFKGEFSRSDAWVWLIERAAWKPAKVRIKGQTVPIARGELSFSVRFMAEAWGWSKSRVDRFLADLREESMIETRSKIGTSAGHSAGQGQSIITICNYGKYQDRDEAKRDNDDAEIGTSAGQQRDKEEEGKEGKKEEGGGFAFCGDVVRLSFADFRKWQTSFPDLDLRAQLQTRDDWLTTQPEDAKKRWFLSTSSWLASQQAKAARDGGEARKAGVIW